MPDYRRGNSGRWKGESKRRRKCKEILRSLERNSKDVWRKDKGDAHSDGDIGNNTAE